MDISRTRKNTLFTLAVFLCALPTWPQASDFQVQRFSMVRSIPKSELKIITTHRGEYLKSIKPRVPKGGEFCLRFKYSEKEYCFYRGTLKPEQYQFLTAYELKNSRYIERVKFKYYDSKKAAPHQDFQHVYFDKHLIYTEGKKTLYYFNKEKWCKLKPLPKKPVRLSVTSNVPEAIIHINGTLAGPAPVTASGLLGKGAKVLGMKQGYYTHEVYTPLQKHGLTSMHIELRKVKFINEIMVDSVLANAPLANELNTSKIEAYRHKLSQMLNQIENQEIQILADEYPRPTERGKGESQSAYKRRQADYRMRKEECIQSIKRQKNRSVLKIQKQLAKFETVSKNFMYRRYIKYFPVSTVIWGTYNASITQFPVTVEVKDGDFDFVFAGHVQISKSFAPEFKKLISDAQLKLVYINHPISVALGPKQVKRYIDFPAITINVGEVDYELDGEFIFPTYIESSPATEAYHNKKHQVSDQRNKKDRHEPVNSVFQENDRQRKANIQQYLPEMREIMVEIPAGCFYMGRTSGPSEQQPLHRVCLEGFKMDKTEVTQQAYANIMGVKPSYFENCEQCPVEQVTWDDAQAFCNTVGKRLPTEAEWEYASRGGVSELKAWGHGLNGDEAWYRDNSKNQSQITAKKKPNAWGLYDMMGNVWEWCSDWYRSDFYKRSPSIGPVGPQKGTYRVVRGGGWKSPPEEISETFRSSKSPDSKSHTVGFRCVQ